MSEEPKTQKYYTIPHIEYENASGNKLLFYKFADALIEQQSLCKLTGSYERHIDCMISKQQLAKAYWDFIDYSAYNRKKASKFKKLMDTQKKL